MPSWSWSMLSVLCALSVGVVSGFVARRSAKESSSIDRFAAIVNALDARIADLEREVQTVKSLLKEEQVAHHRTAALLRVALRHIRDVVAWDKTRAWQEVISPTPMPAVPDELLGEL